jgi:CheY-like chemotaxis protein
MPTVFLVEDNPADVELFRMALQNARVECDLVLFEDGRQVIDRICEADSAAPDLIMLDLNLPKNDGLEILKIIRERPAFARVPIAVLSSSSSARERAKLVSFHVREFISKPPDLEGYMQIGKVVRDLLQETSLPS